MATECSQEAVVRFLTERGGRVKNVDLVDHFKPLLPGDPAQRSFVKRTLRTYVDNVATVQRENGTKFLCLRKKYLGSARCVEELANGDCNGNAMDAGDITSPQLRGGQTVCAVNGETRGPSQTSPLLSVEFTEEDSLNQNLSSSHTFSRKQAGYARCSEKAAKSAAEPETPPFPRSGYRIGEAERRQSSSNSSGGVLEIQLSKTAPKKGGTAVAPQIHISPKNDFLEMGNANNTGAKRPVPDPNKNTCLGPQSFPGVCIPQIAVIEASPLPVEAEGTMFNLPENDWLNQQCEQPEKQDKICLFPKQKHEGGGLPAHGQGPSEVREAKINMCKEDRGAPLMQAINKRRSSKGSQRSLLSSNPSADGLDEGQVDTVSLSGSDSNTPRSSRKNFIQLMMNSSPQVRRSMVLKNNCYSAKIDGDVASTLPPVEDYGGSVALDPLEHEWMMCSSDGEWENLHRLLLHEPNLIMKKDFVTGFTCLHWAAKLGKHELLTLLVNFAKQNSVAVNINIRSGAGYTPLHLAAMHNHLDLVRLLVEEYDADIEARDYDGKTAGHYLSRAVPEELRDVLRRQSDPCVDNIEAGAGRWTPSKPRASSLMPLNLFNHPEEDESDCESLTKTKPGNRKAAMNMIKPRLRKIRVRSKIVHSSSFREAEEGDAASENTAKSRPKSNLFG